MFNVVFIMKKFVVPFKSTDRLKYHYRHMAHFTEINAGGMKIKRRRKTLFEPILREIKLSLIINIFIWINRTLPLIITELGARVKDISQCFHKWWKSSVNNTYFSWIIFSIRQRESVEFCVFAWIPPATSYLHFFSHDFLQFRFRLCRCFSM